MSRVQRVAGVILAAGTASRFGRAKLLESLDGSSILRHVVDAAVDAGLEPIVVVEPPDGSLAGLDLTPAIRTVNPTPADGLSGSVRLGLRLLDADVDLDRDRPIEAAVILPGDQPRVRPTVIRALVAAAALDADAGFVVPRYAADGGRNPVLARRSVWRLADELAGDHGFGPLLAAHPELIREVAIDGANPDVDTLDDLRRLASEPAEPGGPSPDVS